MFTWLFDISHHYVVILKNIIYYYNIVVEAKMKTTNCIACNFVVCTVLSFQAVCYLLTHVSCICENVGDTMYFMVLELALLFIVFVRYEKKDIT